MSTVSRQALLLFSGLALLFGMVTIWILQNNYSNDAALTNWAVVKSAADAATLQLANFGFNRPHGPMLLLLPFAYLPWPGAYTPFIVSALLIAFLFTLWNKHLKEGGYNNVQRGVLILLMAINPALLWGATGGSDEAIALLMFYLLYRACLRMIYEKDIRAFISLGLILAGFSFFDAMSLFLFVSLLPLLPLIVPKQMLRESIISVYIIICMPLLIAIGAWFYSNWIFLGDPLAFLHSYNSAFTGAKGFAETLPWQREFGGEFLRPTVVALGYVIFCFPVLLFLLARSHHEGRQLRISAVLMLHPILAVGIATYYYYLASPLQFIILLAAAVMAEITRLGCQRKTSISILLAMLLAGAVSSWLLFVHGNYSYIKPWISALTVKQAPAHPGERALGEWLAQHRQPTLIDLDTSHAVIAARGDARGLLLPFTTQYRIALRSDLPDVPQIALPDPLTSIGQHDEINARYPRLYESGMMGYRLVYDKEGWRVYQKLH